MIEVAIAIGVIAILAGAVAPLALKALNQQREQKTRENLKTAWEALFGAKDRRVANMRADFGFNPAPGTYTLGKMLNRTTAPAPNPPVNFAANGGSLFNWGWNGPYWTGSTRLIGGVQTPIDAWGNTIQLRYVNAGPFLGFQLLSWGPNGTNNTSNATYIPQGDDIVYPTLPQILTSSGSGTLNLSIKNNSATAITGTYRVRWRTGGAALSNPNPTTIPGGIAPGASFTRIPPFSSIPSGPIQVEINIASASGFTSNEVIDLLPGESRTLNYNIY
jgi:type II secretory pathway pseudopilin PulG